MYKFEVNLRIEREKKNGETDTGAHAYVHIRTKWAVHHPFLISMYVLYVGGIQLLILSISAFPLYKLLVFVRRAPFGALKGTPNRERIMKQFWTYFCLTKWGTYFIVTWFTSILRREAFFVRGWMCRFWRQTRLFQMENQKKLLSV